ncbi:endolytic transglycosylase MltG [Treponema pedis]|uniref:endolytic transglycosylase MltG n=1 Tax=Treponema pedis TaxID=409322 RepID=UPI0003FC1A07|nr:endolytic transglycosylase MltG [Treponema pedis]
MKKSLKIGIILSALVLCLSGALFYFLSLNAPPKNLKEGTKTFKVNRGAAAKTVIRNLKDEGLIQSEYYAYIFLRLKKLNLKAGSYTITPEMTAQEILQKLTEGTQAIKKITVPEGLTLKKTARLFEKEGFMTAEKFIKLATDSAFLKANGIKAETAEGFLFPDTYFFGEEDTPEMMFNLIFKTFFEKTSAIPNFPKDFDELYKKIILASIVEREYQIKEEAPVIAGVFVNRLKINMGLQSCATVEYIITEIQNKKHPKRLFYEDLEIESPYNTYLYAGLPPSPIANPGYTALEAACNPAKTEYFYFRLIDPSTGKHAFSRTINEHNKADASLYLKGSPGNNN